MSDPADKSDDLIAELAKLMAAPTGKQAATVEPIARPAPLDPNVGSRPAPPPIRIPGMDAPAPVAPDAAPPANTAAPAPEHRAPATGSIRIPGMDQPAPVSTSAPVSKFDFGKPVAAGPIKQEPLSTLSERLAAQNPSPSPSPGPAPVRIPSSLTPVSENRSFAEGPARSVGRPATPPPASSSDDFAFDFGFGQNPPPSGAGPRPVPPQPQAGPPPAPAAAADPIAALIEADIADSSQVEADEEPQIDPVETEDEAAPPPQAGATPVVTPIFRTVGSNPGQARPVVAPAVQGGTRPAANAPIPLKPISVAPRPPESDRFAISPGVGLNMKPPAGQPLNAPVQRAPQPAVEADESDPMSEIESLIGEAVRVELSPGPVKIQVAQQVSPKVQLEAEDEVEREIDRSASSPVVPPLTTQFAPRRANLKDDAGTRSAEDAILAAAAASGGDVGRMEPSIANESPYRRLKVKPERSSFFSGGLRQYIGMAVAGTLLLAAGLGLYWVLNMGRAGTTGANAPQLTADATPVKAKPVVTQAPPTDAAKSPVLAKLDGASAAPSSEQLVSTEQPTDVSRDVTPVADADNESGLANRKVRTVTVRPDGTIVSGDDALAGGEALPIERPNVPSVPSTEATNLLGNDAAATDTTDPLVPDDTASAASPTLAPLAPGAGTDTQVAEVQPVIDPNAIAPVPMSFPVRAAARTAAPQPTNTSVNALTGAATPNGQIDLLGGSDPAPAPQVAVADPVPVASGDSGAVAYVQLSSQPSQGDAAASVKSMTAKYGSLFGGTKLVVQQVDLGQKGIRWRVRLPTSSLADASNICAQVKAQGGDCFATNG
jgi:hypothetical protein